MPVDHLNISFGKMSIRSFKWVVCFLILSCMSCLYVLDINPLLVISFTNIFSHSVGGLFLLSIASFAVQNLLGLILSHLKICCFCFLCLRRQIQKNIAMIYVKECSAYVLGVLWFQVLHLDL